MNEEVRNLVQYKYSKNIQECYDFIQQASTQVKCLLCTLKDSYYLLRLYGVCKLEQSLSLPTGKFPTLAKILKKQLKTDLNCSKVLNEITSEAYAEYIVSTYKRKFGVNSKELRDISDSFTAIIEISHLIAIAVMTNSTLKVVFTQEECNQIHRIIGEMKEDTEENRSTNALMQAMVKLFNESGENSAIAFSPTANKIYDPESIEALRRKLNLPEDVTRNNRIYISLLNVLNGTSGKTLSRDNNLEEAIQSKALNELNLITDGLQDTFGTTLVYDNYNYSVNEIDNILNDYLNNQLYSKYKDNLSYAATYVYMRLQLLKIYKILESSLDITCHEQLKTYQEAQIQAKALIKQTEQSKLGYNEKISSLEEKLAQYEKQMSDLKGQLKESEQKCEKMERKLTKANMQNQDYLAQIDDLEAFIEKSRLPLENEIPLSISERVKYINTFDYAYIGGNPAAQANIKRILYTNQVFSIEQAICKKTSLSIKSFLLLDVSFTGHSAWYKFKHIFSSSNIIYVYPYTNEEQIINEIYNKIKQQEFALKEGNFKDITGNQTESKVQDF